MTQLPETFREPHGFITIEDSTENGLGAHLHALDHQGKGRLFASSQDYNVSSFSQHSSMPTSLDSTAKRQLHQQPMSGSVTELRPPKRPLPPRPHQQPAKMEKLIFACPFCKLDPRVYRDCLRFRLTRIRDVVQHLKRKHADRIHCPRCNEVFDRLGSLVIHQQSGKPCELRKPAHSVLISRSQLDELSKMRDSSRVKSAREQWMDMWLVLFPTIDPPESPYLETYDENNVVSRLRKAWESCRTEIAEDVIQRAGFPLATQRDQTVEVLDLFLQLLLKRFATAGTETQPEFSSASDITSCSPAGSFRGSGKPLLDLRGSADEKTPMVTSQNTEFFNPYSKVINCNLDGELAAQPWNQDTDSKSILNDPSLVPFDSSPAVSGWQGFDLGDKYHSLTVDPKWLST
ncbi:hypothetical protein B0H67DRAFT_573014 [Lasiosphaeris hirsuta]|uniref:C2H2-type domain-containing protein n=1 Tax=Lasiosphaeris hirsuta TaxID=260670 RepID=A0AA40DXN0_9PEZI|nr:hypothetical protein B0H67DRAFT_573014 [Lasiosphaeris hirsuta]